jgi:hypothetical protein
MAEKKGVDKVTFGKSKGIFVRVTELPRVADIGVAVFAFDATMEQVQQVRLSSWL